MIVHGVQRLICRNKVWNLVFFRFFSGFDTFSSHYGLKLWQNQRSSMNEFRFFPGKLNSRQWNMDTEEYWTLFCFDVFISRTCLEPPRSCQKTAFSILKQINVHDQRHSMNVPFTVCMKLSSVRPPQRTIPTCTLLSFASLSQLTGLELPRRYTENTFSILKAKVPIIHKCSMKASMSVRTKLSGVGAPQGTIATRTLCSFMFSNPLTGLEPRPRYRTFSFSHTLEVSAQKGYVSSSHLVPLDMTSENTLHISQCKNTVSLRKMDKYGPVLLSPKCAKFGHLMKNSAIGSKRDFFKLTNICPYMTYDTPVTSGNSKNMFLGHSKGNIHVFSLFEIFG